MAPPLWNQEKDHDNIQATTVVLGLSIDDEHDETLLLDLARRFELTVYDAAYLEVAFRRSLPLATLDHRLRKAAEAMGIAVVQRHT